MKTYCNKIGKPSEREVYVFGSNMLGHHEYGYAGHASGLMENIYYASLPVGTVCWLNVKGCAVGLQKGREGTSYALPTCAKPGVGLPPCAIVGNIRDLYNCMRAFEGLDFLVTYTAHDTASECGLHIAELARLFADAANPDIPPNAVFEAGFARLIESELKS